MAKLGTGWLNMQVTSSNMSPESQETRNVSVDTQKFACLSLEISSRAKKFPRWLNWETSRGHMTCGNVARDIVFGVSPRLAKHAIDKLETCPMSQGFAFPSLQIFSRTTKFQLAKLGDIEGTCHAQQMWRATCLLV